MKKIIDIRWAQRAWPDWDWRSAIEWAACEHNYRHREQHRATDEGMPKRVP